MTMPCSQLRWVMLVSSLLLAACSPSDPAQPTTLPTPPTVTRPPAVVPQDRDPQAVLAALRQLDPCALVDPARAGVPGYPASLEPVPYSPHRCEVYRTYGDDEVEVILGAPFDEESRWNTAVVTIGGVKAYRSAHTDSCDLHIPVSFQLTIHFWVRKGVHSTSNGDMCAPATGFAEYAVTRLADPDNAPSVLPMADRDACQVLTAALGANPDGYRVAFNDSLNGIDACGGDIEDPERAAPTLAARLVYNPDPAQQRDSIRTIGGRPVRVYEQPDYCHLTWSVGKVRTPERSRTDQQVELQAPDCRMGKAMVLAAMTHMQQPPPPVAAAPQRPITYRPDEPDLAVPGAYVAHTSINDPRYCQPAVNVPVPSGSTEIITGATTDPHVVCAFSRAAITGHFGQDFSPIVTTGHTCVFVEPTRAVEIQVRVDPDSRPQASPGTRRATIAGHAATFHDNITDTTGISYEIAAAVTPGTDPGMVIVTVRFRHPRGVPHSDTTPIDTALASKLEPAVTDMLTTHFATR